MAIFDDKTAKQLKDVLNNMKKEVKLLYFTQDFECNSCKDTRTFLEEISSFSDNINLKTLDFVKDKEVADKYEVDKIPAIVVLDSEENYTGMKFFGIPAGYEINSFIASLLEVSGVDEALPSDISERIANIKDDIHIQVFVTLSCPYCPGAVINAHKLALLNKNVKADMVETGTFPHMAYKYNVSGVPKIVINEKYELVGNQPIEAFLQTIESI